MSYYFYKRDNVSTCCNLILWDLFISTLCISNMVFMYIPDLTGFQRFFIGLVASLILTALIAIPYLGMIIQILFSLFWAAALYSLADTLFHISGYDTAWRYGIGCFCFLVTFSLHLGSAEDMDLFSFSRPRPVPTQNYTNYNTAATTTTSSPSAADIQEDVSQCEQLFSFAISLSDHVNSLADNELSIPIKKFVKKNTSDLVRQYNRFMRSAKRYKKSMNDSLFQQLTTILDDTILMEEQYLDALQAMLDDYEEASSHDNFYQGSSEHNTSHTTYGNSPSDYFTGCDTLDKLNKRYRDLVKIYHSDSGNGNDAVFIKITDEYNVLKENFTR